MFRCFDPDGLNQLATVNGTAAAYDGRGNMTTDPVTGKTYSYLPSNNQLYNMPSPFATFTYDYGDSALFSRLRSITVTDYGDRTDYGDSALFSIPSLGRVGIR